MRSHVRDSLDNKLFKAIMVVLACNPSAQESEAGGLRVGGPSGPHSKMLSGREGRQFRTCLWCDL